MNVSAAGAAVAVQVSLRVFEIGAAIARHKGIGAPIVCDIVGGGTARVTDVEVGDKRAGVLARVITRLVEHVDVVAARAAARVQVLVDERPALIHVSRLQAVHLAFEPPITITSVMKFAAQTVVVAIIATSNSRIFFIIL